MTPAEAATPIVVRTHDGLGDAASVAEWDALATRDPDATLFQRARWLARWESVLAGQRQVRTRTFRRDGGSSGCCARRVSCCACRPDRAS
jgi:hypothetical protein